MWACRACKRMRRVMDRRAMATVRERRRLGKVRPEMKTRVRLDFVPTLNRKK